MQAELYLGTSNGVVKCIRQAEAWQIEQRMLDGQTITSLSASPGSLLVGTPQGIWRSADGGATWLQSNTGLEILHIRALAHHPVMSELSFAGTEPAGIFISFDAGQSWQIRSEIVSLRERQHWYLPYSPEAGCIRSFAFFDLRAYAAVEVGGLLVSSDGGETWRLLQDSRPESDRLPHWVAIHPDVHSVLTHPSSADLIFASTGGGFFRSVDAGRTWRRLHLGYVRAAWVDPQNAEFIILGPAEREERNGTLIMTRDGGKNWEEMGTGLSLPWKKHQVEHFTPAGRQLLGILSNGDLIYAELDQPALTWRYLLPEIKGVRAVAAGFI